jgi:hypothetical protein
MTPRKGAYAAPLFDCRSQQETNVFVIQYERMTSEITAGEQLGNFPFGCDRSFRWHDQPRALSAPNPPRPRALRRAHSDF